ncbi:hypothetical protein OsJ_24003 [Oryza sativa Japonica Group]|uniref:Uncharacterized protein n=1 Tax=Oryza sativa subsp. japonica TaxID=39947 RepID=A3BJ27_ORYSJ|nr:hypothetical protein OsJ_24003 [Oryza sativa Japonica Group]
MARQDDRARASGPKADAGLTPEDIITTPRRMGYVEDDKGYIEEESAHAQAAAVYANKKMIYATKAQLLRLVRPNQSRYGLHGIHGWKEGHV